MNDHPTFSILHTSARPDAWRAVYDAWIKAAVRPDDVEYILVIDPRWGFPPEPERTVEDPKQIKCVVNTGRMCYVDGVNIAAEHATGRVLIVVADDQFLCVRWDDVLRESLPISGQVEIVARVPTGTPQERERNITVMPIVSRARYERLGYLLYPGYESMFADNDLTEHAQQDGCFVELSSLPVFPHRHAWFDATNTVPFDAAYARQNRPEAYEIGARVLAERRANGFGSKLGVVGKQETPPGFKTDKNLALCLPGEWYHSMWVAQNALMLGVHLSARFKNVWPVMPVIPCVYRARHVAVENIRELEKQTGQKVDYVLWIDDDNLLTPEEFEMLLRDLETHPELAGVVGWCWIYGEGRMSCGPNAANGAAVSFDYHKVMAAPGDLMPINFDPADGSMTPGWSGFPIVLHRGDVLAKLGQFPFRPILNDAWRTGMSGEDTSFFERATDAGLKFCCDKRVHVPHLKFGNPEPEFVFKEREAAKDESLGSKVRRIVGL